MGLHVHMFFKLGVIKSHVLMFSWPKQIGGWGAAGGNPESRAGETDSVPGLVELQSDLAKM